MKPQTTTVPEIDPPQSAEAIRQGDPAALRRSAGSDGTSGGAAGSAQIRAIGQAAREIFREAPEEEAAVDRLRNALLRGGKEADPGDPGAPPRRS